MWYGIGHGGAASLGDRPFHIHHGLTYYLSINQALAKGDPMDVSLLLCCIPDIGGEFASLDPSEILHRDKDAKIPFLTVCVVMWRGLNCILDIRSFCPSMSFFSFDQALSFSALSSFVVPIP